ncbi:unnamed protein product [Onchocerca flexuosa]|uniref:Transcriptional regulator n=1 Tax=Onchocerca flexuosa TaxID=387005 RepID=A0A183HM93_9BILA|nr:unnamed protein product [Onchocerca flexuosa]
MDEERDDSLIVDFLDRDGAVEILRDVRRMK